MCSILYNNHMDISIKVKYIVDYSKGLKFLKLTYARFFYNNYESNLWTTLYLIFNS